LAVYCLAAEDEVRWNEAVNLHFEEAGAWFAYGGGVGYLHFTLGYIDYEPQQHGFLSAAAMQNWSDGPAAAPD
jgi:hypothetical protein